MLGSKIYEGKAKILYKNPDNDSEIYQYFKDDATAFNNQKKSVIDSKGVLNNFISEYIMLNLRNEGVNNHFIKRIDERVQLVKKLDIIPLEVIVRNYSAGSFAKRLNVPTGKELKKSVIEFCLKDDALGDPLINDYHIQALNIASINEITHIKEVTLQINDFLLRLFKDINIKLIDFNIEFGRSINKEIILADEISPDSCRLWDINTGEKMDKDRFRLDLGDLAKYYKIIADRLNINLNEAQND